jgi:hypothetical protein
MDKAPTGMPATSTKINVAFLDGFVHWEFFEVFYTGITIQKIEAKYKSQKRSAVPFKTIAPRIEFCRAFRLRYTVSGRRRSHLARDGFTVANPRAADHLILRRVVAINGLHATLQTLDLSCYSDR